MVQWVEERQGPVLNATPHKGAESDCLRDGDLPFMDLVVKSPRHKINPIKEGDTIVELT